MKARIQETQDLDESKKVVKTEKFPNNLTHTDIFKETKSNFIEAKRKRTCRDLLHFHKEKKKM